MSAMKPEFTEEPDAGTFEPIAWIKEKGRWERLGCCLSDADRLRFMTARVARLTSAATCLHRLLR